MPPSPAPTPDPAEVARREQELHEAEALLADLKRRKALDGASMSNDSSGKGISGWLIRKKIVAEESQANIALLGVVIVAMVLAGMIFVWSNSALSAPGLTRLQPMQNPLHPTDNQSNTNASP